MFGLLNPTKKMWAKRWGDVKGIVGKRTFSGKFLQALNPLTWFLFAISLIMDILFLPWTIFVSWCVWITGVDHPGRFLGTLVTCVFTAMLWTLTPLPTVFGIQEVTSGKQQSQTSPTNHNTASLSYVMNNGKRYGETLASADYIDRFVVAFENAGSSCFVKSLADRHKNNYVITEKLVTYMAEECKSRLGTARDDEGRARQAEHIKQLTKAKE